MIAYEFSTQITPNGELVLPSAYMKTIPKGSVVRVLLLVDETAIPMAHNQHTVIEDDSPTDQAPDGEEKSIQRKNKLKDTDLPREEVIQHLVTAGRILEPESRDDPFVRAWQELPEEERQRHIKEMNETYFPDSPASRAVIENRRGPWGEPTRTEVIARLVSEGLIPQPGSWDDDYARLAQSTRRGTTAFYC